MRLAHKYTKTEWICSCCGETEIRENLSGKPKPGICPKNSTPTEEKPHIWIGNLTF